MGNGEMTTCCLTRSCRLLLALSIIFAFHYVVPTQRSGRWSATGDAAGSPSPRGLFPALQHRQRAAAKRARARRVGGQRQQTRAALERARPGRGMALRRPLLALARPGGSPVTGRPRRRPGRARARNKRRTGGTVRSQLPRRAEPSLTGAGAARPKVGLLVEAGTPQRGPRPIRRCLLPPVQVAAAGNVGRAGYPVAQL